jgi:hypothetical protein
VELKIEPEPSPEERAVIVAALEPPSLDTDRRSAWGRSELEDALAAQPACAPPE